MITARPLRYTAHLAAHHVLWSALGATLLTDPADEYRVYSVGSGRLALRPADSDHPSGQTRLGFETTDPPALAAGIGAGPLLCGPDGTPLTLDPQTPDPRQVGHGDPSLLVMPIWYTPDTAGALQTLRSLGARERLVSDSGTWTDLRCPDGGLVAVHAASECTVELAFSYDGDVEALLPALTAAGIGATLIDETYARTLRLPDPDRDAEIWINERQSDLYGYRRLEP